MRDGKPSGTTIDAICEEIRFQKAEAMQWKHRAVEERRRYDRLRDAAQDLITELDPTDVSDYRADHIQELLGALRAALITNREETL